MTRQAILKMARQISRFYDEMAEANEMVQICGYGDNYQKEIHIYNMSDLLEIADIVGISPKRDDFLNRLEVVIKGVHFFSIFKESEDTE